MPQAMHSRLPREVRNRDKREVCLEVWFPSPLVFAPPKLHRVRIILNPPVFRVEMQFPIYLPSDVGKLQHRNGDVADRDRGVQLLTFSDCRDEVREVSVGHGIPAEEIGR